MSSSDNKNIPNVNINNSWQNKQYPGTVIQPTSSENVNPNNNFKNYLKKFILKKIFIH